MKGCGAQAPESKQEGTEQAEEKAETNRECWLFTPTPAARRTFPAHKLLVNPVSGDFLDYSGSGPLEAVPNPLRFLVLRPQPKKLHWLGPTPERLYQPGPTSQISLMALTVIPTNP